jgi:hypothetical protein
MAVYDATGAWPFRPLLTAHRGTAILLAGRVDAALGLGREALALARGHGEGGHEAWALRLPGEVAAGSAPPDPDRAERHYRDAAARASELDMRPLLAHCQLDLGALSLRRGDGAGGRACLATAAAMYVTWAWTRAARRPTRRCPGAPARRPRRAARSPRGVVTSPSATLG